MKKLKKIMKILISILAVLAVLLTAGYLYADNSPYIRGKYYENIQTGGEIEAYYLKMGELETKKVTEKAPDPIKKYTIYYPAEMESNQEVYPMILVVNGTGGKATRYEPEFELYASWGFIVVGTQDKGTGTGQTTVDTLNHMLEENDNPDSIFYHKIDEENIGITGFSQGGAAVFNVLTKYDESEYFKTAVALSPVSESTAMQMTDYPYDSAAVNCPILMFAGTEGEFETEIVIPLEQMNQIYEKISTTKIMARKIGMTHDDMMYSAGGYVVAWFMWQLQDDEEAAKAFVGEDAELWSNELYQDVQIDIE
ncbi:MAG: prolyl oligopeptidase family serine peptidase [Clostridiales bacterium]|nr:prolyl oligopeptidase family serine peptidase [Clostridiales bacterium]